MRSRGRDRQKIYFVAVTEKKSGINTIKEYGKPEMKKMAVSSGAGQPGQVSAGLVVDYDREITSYDLSLRYSFQEGDTVFVDVEPELDDDGYLVMEDDGVTPVTPPDYRITQIFRTQKGKIDVFGVKKIGGRQ